MTSAGAQYAAHVGATIPRHVDYPEQGERAVEDPTREGEELPANDVSIEMQNLAVENAGDQLASVDDQGDGNAAVSVPDDREVDDDGKPVNEDPATEPTFTHSAQNQSDAVDKAVAKKAPAKKAPAKKAAAKKAPAKRTAKK